MLGGEGSGSADPPAAPHTSGQSLRLEDLCTLRVGASVCRGFLGQSSGVFMSFSEGM